jgi:putative hemolysin
MFTQHEDPGLVPAPLAPLLDPGGGSPVAPALPLALVQAEVEALLPTQTLVEHGPLAVLFLSGAQAPAVLWELGRLRELTFRAAGEGSGKALDLDAFDDHYLHLVAWDRRAGEVVGAYRLGRVDRIAASQGVQGLYTRSLWRFDQALIDALGPALELGRSFIRPQAQRSPLTLSLLWRGIGAWLVRHPEVRALMGPVSIDRRYRDDSVQRMAGHLLARRQDPRLAALVQAREPLRICPTQAGLGAELVDVDELDQAVAALEPDGRGVPVLLRQYLKLGARVLSLNVDPDFADVVDALIVVDLDEVEPRRLRRFMGEREHDAWRARGPTRAPLAAVG